MRQLISLLVILLLALPVCADEDHTIVVVRPWDNVNLLVNTTNYSSALDLNTYKPIDFKFSMQVQATNILTATAGIVTVSYELSNNNVDYLTNVNVCSGYSYTNSPTSGGKGFYFFETGKARYIRFKAIVTQTNTWLTGWLAIQ